MQLLLGVIGLQAPMRLEDAMARKTSRAALRISDEEHRELEGLAQSPAPWRLGHWGWLWKPTPPGIK